MNWQAQRQRGAGRGKVVLRVGTEGMVKDIVQTCMTWRYGCVNECMALWEMEGWLWSLIPSGGKASDLMQSKRGDYET